MKTIIAILLCLAISVCLFSQIQPTDGYVVNYTLLFFSDTHVGRGKGLDNLTAIQRYQKLIDATNGVSANFMVNLGDLTDGWWLNNTKQTTMYRQYMNASASSTHRIFSARGNHDANNSAFIQYVNPTLNTAGKYGNIAFFILGVNEKDAQSWLTKGECYYQYQADMLERFVHSTAYNASQYHFLFMHFQPNSTWPSSHEFSVPQYIQNYLPFFSVVFCGHEGGKERAFTLNGTLVIKAAHLGDGKPSTDSYLKATIQGTTKILTIVSVNFLTGTQTQLWKGAVW